MILNANLEKDFKKYNWKINIDLRTSDVPQVHNTIVPKPASHDFCHLLPHLLKFLANNMNPDPESSCSCLLPWQDLVYAADEVSVQKIVMG